MNTCEMTSLDLFGTFELITELDKRSDRVIVIMESDTQDPNRPGMDFLIHNNTGFRTKEHLIFSLMSHVRHLVDECLGEQDGS